MWTFEDQQASPDSHIAITWRYKPHNYILWLTSCILYDGRILVRQSIRRVNDIRPSTQRFVLSDRLADGHISLRYLLAPLASFCLAGRLRSLLALTDVSSSNTATMQEGLMSPPQ